MPPSPQGETAGRLVPETARTRGARLAHPSRPDLHHHTRNLLDRRSGQSATVQAGGSATGWERSRLPLPSHRAGPWYEPRLVPEVILRSDAPGGVPGDSG